MTLQNSQCLSKCNTSTRAKTIDVFVAIVEYIQMDWQLTLKKLLDALRKNFYSDLAFHPGTISRSTSCYHTCGIRLSCILGTDIPGWSVEVNKEGLLIERTAMEAQGLVEPVMAVFLHCDAAEDVLDIYLAFCTYNDAITKMGTSSHL